MLTFGDVSQLTSNSIGLNDMHCQSLNILLKHLRYVLFPHLMHHNRKQDGMPVTISPNTYMYKIV